MTKAMTQANKLVSELQGKSEKLQQSIDKMEAEIERLNGELDTSDNKFDMEVVQKNKAIRNDINLMTETLEEAKAELEQMIQGNVSDTFNRALTIVQANQKEKSDQHKADNLEIIEHINAIREKVKYLKEKDTEYTAEADAFINEVRPFLDNEPVGPARLLTDKKYQKLWNKVHRAQEYNVIDAVREQDFLIDGLLIEPSKSEKEQKELARFS